MDGERGEIGLADAVEEAVAAGLPEAVEAEAEAAGPSPGTVYVLPMEDGTEALRQAVGAQLEAVSLWWERRPPEGPGFVRVAPGGPVTSRHDVERFLETAGVREGEPDVPVVLYVTGHGLTGGAGRHFAVLSGTDPGRLLGTGLRTTEIVIAALDSHARDVLVIVNMCESAALRPEVLELVESLDTARTEHATLNVLTTAAPKSRVMGGEFALVLRRAHEWLRTAGGITRAHLTMEEFGRALYQAAQAIGREQGRKPSVHCLALTVGRQHVPTAALPNPGHRPEETAVEESRREVAASLEDLGYWLEKASGRTGADDPGWYFSGRRELNTAVVSFLTGAPGVLVVTGITASGKSAILGRAVTLSDARFRASALYAAAVGHCPPYTVPDEGAVTIAVTAHNREPLGLLKVIAQRLGAAPDPSGRDHLSRWQQGLRKFLDSPGPMVTVVVDALDEATDPAALVHQVLVPLAGHLAHPAPAGAALPVRRGVRLVVAVRSSDGDGEDEGEDADLLGRLREAFPGAAVLRTDGAGMSADVAGYVRALLDGEGGWAGQDLAEVSRTVAGAAGRSFLDARVAAHQLRAEGPRLLADADWLERLGEGTAGLLEDDLVRAAEDGLQADEALALLRATAFAQGRGLAWGEVWPAVASAVAGRAVEDADAKIRVLLEGRLAGYLTRDVEEDQRVYRPAHDRLAAVLRAWPVGGRAPVGGMGMTDAQDDPADNTAATTAGRPTGRAADHTTGQTTDETAGETAGETARQTTGETADQTISQTTGQTTDQTADQTADETARRAAGQTTDETIGQTTGRTSGRTSGQAADETARRAAARAADAAVHARIAEALADLAVPHATGDAATATATAPHPYVRRHLARHARLGGVLDDAHVPAEVLPWLTGSPVRGLLGPGRGREGRLWLEAWAAVEPYLHRADRPSRLASLHLAHTALRHPGLPRPRTPGDATPLAVLWSRWTPPVNVLAALRTTVRSLTAVPAPDGRPALAAGDDEGRIELIDAVEGTAVREPIGAHDGSVRRLLLAPRPAQPPLLVSGSTDGTLRLWDPATGRLLDRVHGSGGIWIADVCAYRDAEHELAVVCVDGNGVVVWWNERMGALDLFTLPGDTPRTTTTALAAVQDPPGRPLLAVADDAHLVFRDPEAGAEVARFEFPADVRVLAPTTRPGTVAAGHADGSVTVWGTGGPLATLTGAGGPVTGLAALTLRGPGELGGRGERHLLAAGAGSQIAVWDISRWDTAAKEPPGLLSGHTAAVTALAPVAVPDADTAADTAATAADTAAGGDPGPDSQLLASASADGTLRLWTREVLERALDAARTPAGPAPTGGALLLPDRPGEPAGPSWFALSGGHPYIDVRDIGTGDAVARIDTGRPPSALAWARRREGRLLVSAGYGDHGIRLWDAETRRALPDVLEGHFLPVRALAACTATGGRHLLLSGGDDETVRLWDLDGPGPLGAWTGHDLRVRAVAAAAGGEAAEGRDWFASAGSDGTVRLWDPEHGQLGAPLRCDQGLLHAVAVNPCPDGGLPPLLASGGDTGTVRLWDLRERRPLGGPLTGHTAAVLALAVWNAGDGVGSFVASGAADGTVRVWDAVTGRCRLLLAAGSPVRGISAHPAAAGGGRVVLSLTGDAGAVVVEVDPARCRAGGA
ncbi:WD40 repeat domain-containing protein [Streptomyces sp. NPDC047976]|uniref:WD40 repeat domain-containing protein n=1 Tax=Streptomyces sp. NPDC047976 TaxID=3155746 RepID=UPI00343AEA6B